MTCEDFVNAVERLMDERRYTGIEGLSSDMKSHINQCTDCKEYFRETEIVHESLTRIHQETIPAELYWRLVHLANERERKSSKEFTVMALIGAVKIIVPVLALWIVGLFASPAARITIEIGIYIFGLALAFEKLGRRLITDRV